MIGRVDFPDGLAQPAQSAIGGKNEGRVHRFADARRARLDLARQRLHRGGVQSLLRLAFGLRIGSKAEALQLADMLALDHHIARGRYFGFQHRVLS